MQFGLFYEIPVPRPWRERSEWEAYQQTLEAAVLALVSDGRLEFGTGRSATRIELEAFGIRPEETRPLWEEALRMIVGAWTEDVFQWQGGPSTFPPRRFLQKPLQKPPPPLWAATTS